MKANTYNAEDKARALRKVRERGNRTQQSIADELKLSLSTLKGWLRDQAAQNKQAPPPC